MGFSSRWNVEWLKLRIGHNVCLFIHASLIWSCIILKTAEHLIVMRTEKAPAFVGCILYSRGNQFMIDKALPKLGNSLLLKKCLAIEVIQSPGDLLCLMNPSQVSHEGPFFCCQAVLPWPAYRNRSKRPSLNLFPFHAIQMITKISHPFFIESWVWKGFEKSSVHSADLGINAFRSQAGHIGMCDSV